MAFLQHRLIWHVFGISQFVYVSWFQNSNRRLWCSEFWKSFGGKFKICFVTLRQYSWGEFSNVTKSVISMSRFVLRSSKNIEIIIWAIFWLCSGWGGVPCALSCADFENLSFKNGIWIWSFLTAFAYLSRISCTLLCCTYFDWAKNEYAFCKAHRCTFFSKINEK